MRLLYILHSFPAAARADPTSVPRHLDVAGGTGDVAFRSLGQMAQHYGTFFNSSGADLPQADRQVVVCDINPEMLQVGV
jgi:ubiquinone/menaquinone biosynthesis C-methylase UbiE